MSKRIIILLLTITGLLATGCRIDHSKPLLITVSSSAYVGTDKIYANFALLQSSQVNVLKDENTLAEYFKTHPGYTTYMLEFVEAGDYILAIQLPVGSPREKLYTYKNITVSKGNASTENNMIFNLSTVGNYQLWTNK